MTFILGRDNVGRLRFVRDIEGKCRSLAAVRCDLIHQFVQFFLAARGNGNGCAFFGKF